MCSFQRTRSKCFLLSQLHRLGRGIAENTAHPASQLSHNVENVGFVRGMHFRAAKNFSIERIDGSATDLVTIAVLGDGTSNDDADALAYCN